MKVVRNCLLSVIHLYLLKSRCFVPSFCVVFYVVSSLCVRFLDTVLNSNIFFSLNYF